MADGPGSDRNAALGAAFAGQLSCSPGRSPRGQETPPGSQLRGGRARERGLGAPSQAATPARLGGGPGSSQGPTGCGREGEH
jgi:hypothetical protein